MSRNQRKVIMPTPSHLRIILATAALLIWQPAQAQASAPDGRSSRFVTEFSEPPPRPEPRTTPLDKPCRTQTYRPQWGPSAGMTCHAETVVRGGVLPAGYEVVRGDRTGPRTGYVRLRCEAGRMVQVEAVCR